MDSVFFAGLDETKNFPLEIREQLSKSYELNSTIKPMTKSERNNLKAADRWHGRAIYNLTKKSIEIWHEDLNQWVLSLDQEYTPPPPKPPWDDTYTLPEIVRSRLSEHEEFKNKIVPMTQVVIDSLSADEIWAGRIIYNISTKTHQLWVVNPWGFGTWIDILNDTYVPPNENKSWSDWDPVPKYENNTNIPYDDWHGLYTRAGYINQNGRVNLYVRFHLTDGGAGDPVSLAETGMLIKCTLPVANATPVGLTHIGRCGFRWYSRSQEQHLTGLGISTISGGSQYVYFRYLKGSGDISELVADNKPDYYYLTIDATIAYEA